MIDERAAVDPSAKIADDVTIGPWAVVGPDVEIGSGSWVGPHAVINGPTRIGKNNKIYQFASIGDAPQDIHYKGEPTELIIGDDNVIREYATINRGTVKGGGRTVIGHQNFIMAYVHIGHDCQVGNQITFASFCALSGHVTVEDYAIIGGYSAIHQFCTVGAYSFVAKACYVTKDVLPYMMIAGHDAEACGLNLVGLKRRGFAVETIENIRRAYKIIFRRGLTVAQTIEELMGMTTECPEIQGFINGLQRSERGIVR